MGIEDKVDDPDIVAMKAIDSLAKIYVYVAVSDLDKYNSDKVTRDFVFSLGRQNKDRLFILYEQLKCKYEKIKKRIG